MPAEVRDASDADPRLLTNLATTKGALAALHIALYYESDRANHLL